ncbi:MAG: hypothetical protein AABZ61_07770 [Bacteroidota bacterium]
MKSIISARQRLFSTMGLGMQRVAGSQPQVPLYGILDESVEV